MFQCQRFNSDGRCQFPVFRAEPDQPAQQAGAWSDSSTEESRSGADR
jgi:hypothetical protein